MVLFRINQTKGEINYTNLFCVDLHTPLPQLAGIAEVWPWGKGNQNRFYFYTLKIYVEEVLDIDWVKRGYCSIAL